MNEDTPWAYELYACPHDCGWTGDLLGADTTAHEDVYGCPECGGLFRV